MSVLTRTGQNSYTFAIYIFIYIPICQPIHMIHMYTNLIFDVSNIQMFNVNTKNVVKMKVFQIRSFFNDTFLHIC